MSLRKVPRDKLTDLPKKYVSGLTDEEKLKQKKEIERTKKIYKETGKVIERKQVSDNIIKRPSVYVKRFEDKYGFKINEIDKIKKMFPDTDIEKILDKGIGAYASGSRPGTTPEQWALARLASVLTGGKAYKVDKDLVGPISLKKIK